MLKGTSISRLFQKIPNIPSYIYKWAQTWDHGNTLMLRVGSHGLLGRLGLNKYHFAIQNEVDSQHLHNLRTYQLDHPVPLWTMIRLIENTCNE